MPGKKKTKPDEFLSEVIVGAMLDKKAKDTVSLKFKNLGNPVCDEFIICHGTSGTQVGAIADHVLSEVKKKTGLNAWHKEGFENAEWILIDYNDIVVHIFLDTRRSFYNLEQLWADAEIRHFEQQE
jgi:ribosome-associated protein